MKNLFFLLLLCMAGANTLFAQTDTSSVKKRTTLIKTNITAPISLGIEKGISTHFSLGAAFLYIPKLSGGDASGDFAYMEMIEPSTGLNIEARYYTSKEKAPLTGFYLGGHYTYRVLEMRAEKSYSETNATGKSSYDVKVTIPSAYTAYGLMLGWQTISKKGFTFDFNIGAGKYVLRNFPEFDTSNPETEDFFKRVNKFREGISPRMTLALGYAF